MVIVKQKTDSKKVKVSPQDKGYTITLEREDMTHVIYLTKDEFLEIKEEILQQRPV